MSCQLAQSGCTGSCVRGMPQSSAACCTQPENDGQLCYAVGPYPDEVIMLALDRILYYLGATKILHQLELANFPAASNDKEPAAAALPTKINCSTSTCSLMGKIDIPRSSSNSSISKYTTAKSKNSIKECAVPKSSSLRSRSPIHKVQLPASCSHPRTPRVDFAHPVVDNRMTSGGASLSTRMKQSLSACSLACRRLKNQLSPHSNDKDQRWVWTRLVHSENGCKVYEVYQNSTTDKKPWKMSNPKQPVIVFLVLPNGCVMPFEMLSSNC